LTRISDDEWFYERPGTLAGALQRGLGRGAVRARTGRHDPETVPAVMACLVRDRRWWWSIDERTSYLATLVRDLRMPLEPLFEVLHAPDDEDNGFGNVLDVLVTLGGKAGSRAAIDGLRAYVADGPRWVEALEALARAWPPELWDDLLPVALRRLPGAERIFWPAGPWPEWADRDDRIGREVAAACRTPDRDRPFTDDTDDTLLAVVGSAETERRRSALRELNRRGPQPALLPILDDLPLDDLNGPVHDALDRLGPAGLSVTRSWAVDPGHPMRWRAFLHLAAYGDESDVPALITAWDWLDDRPDDLCGYDALATGLARIGGDQARTVVVPRLHRLWFSPHSYERTAYLKALLVLDPGNCERKLIEGVFDCEVGVRLIAIERAPRTPIIRRRLHALRSDPLEDDDVRAALR
jgi:hypothetical protein